MLHYFGGGLRDYFAHPIPLKRRPHWEFQGIMSGACTVRLVDRSIPVAGPQLWVFRPEVVHGWSSKTSAPCEIAVFHFDYVPDVLAQRVGEREFLHVDLDATEVETVRSAATETQNYVTEFNDAALLRFDILVHRLALIAVARSDLPRSRPERSLDAERVETALAFFREHMSDGIGVEDVARVVACSVAHLRRLFHSVLGTSVKTALLREQMHMAADRLRDPYSTVSGVADLCGFSCVSSFSRTFRTMNGMSPSQWRASHPRQNRSLNVVQTVDRQLRAQR
jgi:AraC-like DNA-binding protein